MANYLPHTQGEQEQMLSALGMSSMDELFSQVPSSVMLKEPVNIPHGMSQMETLSAMKALAGKNTSYALTLRGAGCYDHFIPPVVTRMAGKEEFVTAYTPYQAEMSQGLLQSIFEYQSLMSELTGMDASNASVYDGASAAAEAAVMCRDRKRTVTLVSEAVHPDTLAVIKTYAYGTDHEVRVVPMKDGVTDRDALSELLAADVSAFYVQQPNFFGQFEDAEGLFALCKEAKVKCILGANSMALAIMKSGAEVGADIVCGDAQPFGLAMAFGGPSLGFMTTTTAMQRKLPGRIVGQTTDAEGRRAFVLTLQAREQHIRREKASSNICSNQAHCALTASIYLNYMGASGIADAANSSMSKAHYLAQQLCTIDGVSLKYAGGYFHEFVTVLPKNAQVIEDALAAEGILSGLILSDHEMLWCVTEKASKTQLDSVVAAVKGVCEA
ncbi:MAG: aminomethyl-transferring glycine dehydrogenase subunit GcvPA [Clostridiales bacterium]|nr:aminomethyl-transferring glycine dehydrogenase subunit GcvPA [Clostridiales bacterium]